jgi:hypothetical protein
MLAVRRRARGSGPMSRVGDAEVGKFWASYLLAVSAHDRQQEHLTG